MAQSRPPLTPITRDTPPVGAARSPRPEPLPLARHGSPAFLAPSHNLPTFLTRFIGREHAIAAVAGLLDSARLLTLSGPGGCGKTRLACAVAAACAAAESPISFADGLWFVEFASLNDPALAPQAIAAVLGVREEPRRPLIETLCDALAPRTLLLVLDNCEHLVAAVADIADTLLHACPHLRLLVTSREALRVPGEITWRVPSLSLPETPDTVMAAHLEASEAVQLFVDRVRLHQSAFTLTDANAPAVAAICHRLDGMPLALELAAARAHVLTMTQLAARLDAALSLLIHGGRTVASRHQTLRATLDWSYALLTEDERVVLRRLAIFAGGCDLAAAEAVCAGDGIAQADVLALLAQLAEKSLVRMEERREAARYRLFETVRQYAEERLHASGDAERIRQIHTDWYCTVAEAAGVALIGRDQQGAMDRLLPEQDNIRKALHRFLDMRRAEQGMRMSTDLWRFYWHQDHFSEGSQWITAFLALDAEANAEHASAAARMDALFAAGRLMIGHGAHNAARAPLAELLTVARQQQDARRISIALTGLGLIAFEQCAFDDARGLHEEAITAGRASGDQFALGQALHNSGTALLMLGETRSARSRLEESLDIVRQLGDGGNVARAQRWHGVLAIIEGNADRARAILAEGLAFHRAGQSMLGIAECLAAFAALHALQGQYARALRIFGAVAAIRETIAVPCAMPMRQWLSGRLAPARQALGDAASADMEQEGRALPVEDAIAAALATGPDAPTMTKGHAASPFGGLSARERAVVALLVTGKTNRRIAEELFIVEKTVELHLSHSMRKLGLHTRAELAVWAVNNGLVDRSAVPPIPLQ
ncbi:MAG: LuxR C-terminal-related transcriptional regulator [Chloroflexota bacterium]|nr:LuxR C-terminal-related transcriptional regulator [Chloroflexota bacterium]